MRGMIMFVGVLIFRVITAADMTAGHTHPQVNPGIPHRQALFAAFRIWSDLLNLISVVAFFWLPPAAPYLLAERFPRWQFASKLFVHLSSFKIKAGSIKVARQSYFNEILFEYR